MKRNITLSAEQGLIRSARQKAATEGTSLNKLFRSWIASYVSSGSSKQDYLDLMSRLDQVRPGKTFNREELNER